ncbi:MAG: hypothetical protein J5644_03810 [Bacteroidales bacterium]|nr:hypothetical protein [Bacteroidales bacterium]
MEILFDNQGEPKLFYGKTVFGSTTKQVEEKLYDTFSFDKLEYASWGDNNRYPDDAEQIIETTSVLKTGLNYKVRCCYGQGVVPVEMIGFDENNNEIFRPVKDQNVLSYLRGMVFRNYHGSAFRDLIKFGNCFPVLVFNEAGNKIMRVQIMNARHCRISVDKHKLLVYGDFKNSMPVEKETVVMDMLDENDPVYDLMYRRDTGRLKGKVIAFPRIKNYFSNNDYYATPDWKSAQESGWIDIAHKIPQFLNKAYENAMHLMWHVQIPHTYWEKKFPKTEYKNVEERKKLIQEYMDKFERELTDVKNANKALWTQYYVDESGRINGDWKITRLDSEIKAEERLSTSAAANSEILFSLMVNPSVLGAGMPGGPYSGNAGSGSDIREGLLVSMILSHIEKQAVLDPVELMLQFNGYQNIDIKYRNITLTTLDSGRNTQESLS